MQIRADSRARPGLTTTVARLLAVLVVAAATLWAAAGAAAGQTPPAPIPPVGPTAPSSTAPPAPAPHPAPAPTPAPTLPSPSPAVPGPPGVAPPTSFPHGDGGVTTRPPNGAAATLPPPAAPAGPPLPDPSPRVHALLAELDVLDAQKAVPPAEQHVTQVQQGADQAGGVVMQARARLAQAADIVRHSEDRLSHLAVSRYVDPGQTALEAVVGGDLNARGKRSVLLAVAIRNEQRFLKAAEQQRDARAADVADALRRKQGADTAVDTARRDADAAHRHVTDAIRIRDDAIAHIHDPGGGTWSLPIAGRSAATPGEMALWFASKGYVSKAQAPIGDLTKLFVQEGNDEAVRGDMAFAQSIVETGAFTNPDTVLLNNFAGVGHCDTCATGFRFSSPQAGIRAQIQLLKSYAEKDPKYKHPLVDKRLHGPAGCCQTWRQLTRTWATAPNYGPVILEMYRQLLVFVVTARGGVVPPGA